MWCAGGGGGRGGSKQTFKALGSAFPQELAAHWRAHGMPSMGTQHGDGQGPPPPHPPSPQQLAFLPSLGLAASPGLAAGRKADSEAGIPDALARSEQDPEPNSPAASAPTYLRRAPAPARRPGPAPGSGDREEELGPRGALQADVKRPPGPHRPDPSGPQGPNGPRPRGNGGLG